MTKSTVFKCLQWFFVAAIFFFLGRMVWENWAEVKKASFDLRAFPLLLSTAVFAGSYLVQIWSWHLITVKLGIAVPFAGTVRSWLSTQMGKYLPGKVWIFLGRFYYYESRGKPWKAITLALYFETATILMSAGLLFLLSVASLGKVSLPVMEGRTGWLLLLAIPAFVLLHPRVLERILNRILLHFKREPLAMTISYADVLVVLGIAFLSWAVGGIGFYLFVDAVFPVPLGHLLFVAGALACSNILGLLALFAPSGLGVREGVLVSLLSVVMPAPVAVVIAVLTRLWMTFIEIGMIGVVYLIDYVYRHSAEAPSNDENG